jgi:hypothetical protein
MNDYLHKEIQRHGRRSFEENLIGLALAFCNFALLLLFARRGCVNNQKTNFESKSRRRPKLRWDRKTLLQQKTWRPEKLCFSLVTTFNCIGNSNEDSSSDELIKNQNRFLFSPKTIYFIKIFEKILSRDL